MTKEARICNGEKAVSSIIGAGKSGHLHVKKEIKTLCITIHQNELNMEERSKYKANIIKLLRKNIRKTLSDK